MRPYTKHGRDTKIFSISTQLMSMKIGGWLAIFMKDLHLGIDSLFNSNAEGDFLQKEPEDAMNYLDEIPENSNTWTGPSSMDSIDRTRTNITTSRSEEHTSELQSPA